MSINLINHSSFQFHGSFFQIENNLVQSMADSYWASQGCISTRHYILQWTLSTPPWRCDRCHMLEQWCLVISKGNKLIILFINLILCSCEGKKLRYV
jgi:hypothetical protein